VSNFGTLKAVGGGTLLTNAPVSVNSLGAISSDSQSVISLGGLAGNTTNVAAFNPIGSTILRGGLAGMPHDLEAMARDMGAVNAGFSSGNFAFGSLVLANNAYVKVTDLADNSVGSGPEVIYANSLTVPGGATLDLGGVHLYVRAAEILGIVTGGAITQIPDSGALNVNTPTPGAIALAGETDEWSFFVRGGQSVTIAVNPGTTGAPAPLAPQLGWANVQLLDSANNALAAASNSASGAVVTLSDIPIASDGSYKIRINAPSSHISSSGNYIVAAWVVTPDVAPAPFNQPHVGTIETPYSVDRWTFSAVAGQQIRFRLINRSSSKIVFSLTGPGGWSGFTDLNTNSDLINLPSSGAYVLTARGTGGQYGGTYSFELQETQVTSLVAGTSYAGRFAGSGQAQLFTVTTAETKPLLVALSDSALDHTEVYVRFGSAPTRQTYDYAANNAGASHSLLIPSANAGTWFILVYGESIQSTPQSYTLRADSSAVVVSSASNQTGNPATGAAFTLSGAGFGAGSRITLVANGGVSYSPTSINLDASTQMTAVFAANTVPPGSYTIRVTQADGSTADLPQPFVMLTTAKGLLNTSIESPGFVGWHIAGTFYVDYSNTGNAPMAAPLLSFTAATPDGYQGAFLTLDSALQTSGFWTSATPVGYANSVQILASGSTPGILQPGESGRVPIYYSGWQVGHWFNGPISFSLTTLQADDTTPLDWPSLKTSLQPQGVSSTAWNTVYSNLLNQMGVNGPAGVYLMPALSVVPIGTLNPGGTAGQYVRLLDNEAAYLGSLGQNVKDISTLWSMAIRQADNAQGPLHPFLASATDDAVPTPGKLSLSFSRAFAQSISGRYTMGPMGLGWSTNWQTKAFVAIDGTVTINVPGGGQRIFQPDSRYSGRFFSEPGDAGTLSADGFGGYVLTEADGTATDFSSSGVLSFVRDTDGNTISAGYSSGRLSTLTTSTGQSLAFTYNGAGLISAVTDSLGRTTSYAYDGANLHLLSVTAYNGQVTSYAYDTNPLSGSQNALTALTFQDGTHELLSYDSQGRLAGISADGGAQAQTLSYTLGEVSLTNAAIATTSLYYDQNNQLAKTVDALGNPTFFNYDSNFNLTRVVNAVGNAATYTYNSVGQVTSATDFLGHTTSFTYTAAYHELSSLTDAKGNTTTYSYNGQGDLTRTTYANGRSEKFTYDPLGNALSFVSAAGQATEYTYNSAGQVTQASFADGTSYSYHYDSQDRLDAATDSGGVTTFTYAAVTGYLLQVAYPDGSYLNFSYDAGGRRIQMVDQTGFTVKYDYDSVGRLWHLIDGVGNPIVTYPYDSVGRLSQKNNANGTYTSYVYDANGNILHLLNYAPGGAINSRFDYTYSSLGLQSSQTTLDGTWTYTYDADGQLTHAVFASNNPASIPSQDLTYNYDSLGNRTSTVVNGVTTLYTTNNMNQYTSVGGVPYSYDANGNLLSDGANTYVYNTINQLTSVTNVSVTTNYTYNAIGQRVATDVGGQTARYLIDPIGLGNVVGEFKATANPTHYTYGIGLVSQVSDGGKYFYDFDSLGSTAGVSNDLGTYANRYAYLPYGAILSSNGTIENIFQFEGQHGVTSDNGFILGIRAREMSGETGRFLSPDPIGISSGDMNLYRYVFNRPQSLLDPSGLDTAYTIEVQLTTPQGWNVPYNHSVGTYHEHIIWVDSNGKITDNIGYGPDGYFEYKNNEIPRIYSVSSDAMDGDTVRRIVGSLGPFFKRGTYFLDPVQRYPHGYTCQTFTQFVRVTEQHIQISVLQPGDPNLKIAPGGYGPSNFIAGTASLPYRIDFENESTATAPAQIVKITDNLAASLDWSTFQLTSVGFGDRNLPIPAGNQHYQTTIPMTYNGQTFDVQLEAALNTTTGQIYANFYSIDPLTGLPPANVLTGFLPPEDGTGRGMGYISYVVKAKSNLPTGTAIRNVAGIVFDGQPLITTNQIDPHDPSKGTDPAKEALVTIDNGTPMSNVLSLPPVQSVSNFTVSWSGVDDASGSGIEGYDIYVSTDGGSVVQWLSDTADTSAVFSGQSGQSYAFYSVARDNVGHVEAAPLAPDAQTTVQVLNSPPIATLSGPNSTWPVVTTIYTLSAYDPDVPDNAAGFTYIIDWGDGTSKTILPSAWNGLLPGLRTSHVFTATGTYTVQLTATDRNGAVGPPIRRVVTVTGSFGCAAAGDDPQDPSKTALFIGGTNANDNLTVSLKNGWYLPTVDGQKFGTTASGFSGINGGIYFFGFGGNDTITVSNSIPNPVVLLGGDGDDKLSTAGTGSAILIGGEGNDTLTAGSARSLLIGGNGKDKLTGGNVDDILIGGRTVYDANLPALGAIMKEWSSGNNYSDRVDHLLGNKPSGFNGAILIRAGYEVFDDALVDALTGGGGQDLWFALISGTNKDQLADFGATETRIAL